MSLSRRPRRRPVAPRRRARAGVRHLPARLRRGRPARRPARGHEGPRRHADGPRRGHDLRLPRRDHSPRRRLPDDVRQRHPRRRRSPRRDGGALQPHAHPPEALPLARRPGRDSPNRLAGRRCGHADYAARPVAPTSFGRDEQPSLSASAPGGPRLRGHALHDCECALRGAGAEPRPLRPPARPRHDVASAHGACLPRGALPCRRGGRDRVWCWGGGARRLRAGESLGLPGWACDWLGHAACAGRRGSVPAICVCAPRLGVWPIPFGVGAWPCFAWYQLCSRSFLLRPILGCGARGSWSRCRWPFLA